MGSEMCIRDRKTIADGLSAAELGEQALEKAKIDVDAKISDAKSEAKNIISMAEKRQSDILDEANVKASEETSKKLKLAEQEVEQLSMRLKESLKKDLTVKHSVSTQLTTFSVRPIKSS